MSPKIQVSTGALRVRCGCLPPMGCCICTPCMRQVLRPDDSICGASAVLVDKPSTALEANGFHRIVFADSVAAERLACEVAPQCAAAREIVALALAVQEVLR